VKHRRDRGGQAYVEITGLKNAIPGRWYFGGPCRECGKMIAVVEDRSRGLGESIEDGKWRATCVHCEATSDFEPGWLQRFRAQPAAARAEGRL
jgi:hypothetical protein